MKSESQGVRATSIGVGFATGIYGISFGALSVAAGLDLYQTMALSVLMFSGGSQFAFVGVIATGGAGSFGAAILSAWLLGVRNGFYAVRMAPILSPSNWLKPIAAQLTIDESNAVSLAQEPDRVSERLGFWLTGVAVFVFWNLSTLMGALLGQGLGEPTDWGLDAAAAAAFLGLIWPRLKDRKSLALGVLALLTATLLSEVLPSGIPVLLSALVAVLFWLFWRKNETPGETA
jgi:predicted branched-subunit amino acid permease